LRGQEASILFGDLAERIATSIRAAQMGELRPRFEADCLTPDGMRAHLGFSISQLVSERSEPTGLVITFQDLTEVRALEETSRRQDRLAAVGRVSAGIAHEIRNPLASMRGAIQVLRADLPADSADIELMEIILRESDRLDRIITDFLSYSRPRSVSLADVDLREPLHETFTLLRHSPEITNGHGIEEDFPASPVPARVDHFSSDMRMFADDLGSNAARFVFNLLFYLLPNFSNLTRITATGHGDAVAMSEFFAALLYAALYASVLIAATVLIFKRRNFK